MLKYISIVVIIIAVVAFYLLTPPKLTRTPEQLNPQYDYIIVGGGTAGSVLAARLSQKPDTSVLLLEAGPEPPWYAHYPGLSYLLPFSPIDWIYKTEPESTIAQNAIHKQVYWPSGKVLGGSTVINDMIVNRADETDFNRWAAMEPSFEWYSFDKMLPYYVKIENAQFETNTKRGTEGPIHVKKVLSTTFCDDVIALAGRKGWATNHNSNEKQQGLFYSEVNIHPNSGLRQSTWLTYLLPALKRDNLHVVVNAHVTKILFNPNMGGVEDAPPSASGVSFTVNSKSHRVLRNNEIIVSSGAIQSPHLLMLSGIGETIHLQQFDIQPLVNLPQVGRNLKDNLMLGMLPFVLNDSAAINHLDELSDPFHVFQHLLLYIINGKGPIASTQTALIGHQTTGLLPNYYKFDIQHRLFLGDQYAKGDRLYMANFDREYLKPTYDQVGKRPLAFYSAILQHPQSDGKIKLKSRDPLAQPKIEPNYAKNDIDVKMIIKGVKKWLDLILKYNRDLHKYNIEMVYPNCDNLDPNTEPYWRCLIRRQAVGFGNPVGTCKMGINASDSVVDSHFRVHGVSGVRVVDSSVFPVTFSGDTSFVTMALAEKAADLIQQG